jgi:hypothetical protein
LFGPPGNGMLTPVGVQEDLMKEAGVFIGWGPSLPGRERKSVELFLETMRYFMGLVAQGRLISVEPVFLEPHGGDLEGFLLLRGDQDELNRLRGEDEVRRLMVKASLILQDLRVVGAVTGSGLNQHLAWYIQAIRQATRGRR